MGYLRFGIVVIVTLYGCCVFAENNLGGDLEGCLARTMKDRLSCESGCGLVLRSCYDEEISDVTEKSDALQSKISSKSNKACSTFASEYVKVAKVMEGDVYKRVEIIPGWIASDLYLNFARQRLENLRAIENGCK
ncbi:hypothetical protein [Burkholderia ambifaria]|uniref:hypothetical protein n=1 Tax=Burkholderia ambifaria TaxID=152480 RepID=UPI00158AACF5|nr:hypothetical protein [Burkholderia ambifaria]